MKYFIIIFILMQGALARADLCSPTWWEGITFDELTEYTDVGRHFFMINSTCPDGNKPIHLAAMANVPLKSINYFLNQIVRLHTFTNLAQENNDGHTLSSFLANENQWVRFYSEVTVEIITLNDIPSSDMDSSPSINEALMQEVCDLTWWENRIQNESQSVEYNESQLVEYLVQDDQDFLTLYNTCEDGNMPIHLAAQAGVSLIVMNVFLGRSVLNHLHEVLYQKNHQGQTPSDLMTENNYQIATFDLQFFLDVEMRHRGPLLRDIEPDDNDNFDDIDDDFDFLNPLIPQR